MNTPDYYFLYEKTLAILGAAALIMGATLFIITTAPGPKRPQNRSALMLLCVAVCIVGAVNLIEYFSQIGLHTLKVSLSIVTFAASIEMFLIWAAFLSLLDKEFLTRRRCLIEIGLILLFTTAPLLLLNHTESTLFDIAAAISLAFYCTRLIINLITYRKRYNKVKQAVEGFHSIKSSKIMAWINRTFYVALTIAIVSIIAPAGNFLTLTLYNTFLIAAYLYIYITLLRNISIFEQNMTPLSHKHNTNKANNLKAASVADTTGDNLERRDLRDNYSSEEYGAGSRDLEYGYSSGNYGLREGYDSGEGYGFMTIQRQMMYQKWLQGKGFTDSSITADDIASILATNRTKLSSYLNKELGVSYYEWIAGLRIEEAKRLLAQTDMRVCEIAYQIGIEDRSNFGKIFKKFVGCSPNEYRKKL